MWHSYAKQSLCCAMISSPSFRYQNHHVHKNVEANIAAASYWNSSHAKVVVSTGHILHLQETRQLEWFPLGKWSTIMKACTATMERLPYILLFSRCNVANRRVQSVRLLVRMSAADPSWPTYLPALCPTWEHLSSSPPFHAPPPLRQTYIRQSSSRLPALPPVEVMCTKWSPGAPLCALLETILQ